jgi:hypothetical protein
MTGILEEWKIDVINRSSELTQSSLPSFNTCACVVADFGADAWQAGILTFFLSSLPPCLIPSQT